MFRHFWTSDEAALEIEGEKCVAFGWFEEETTITRNDNFFVEPIIGLGGSGDEQRYE